MPFFFLTRNFLVLVRNFRRFSLSLPSSINGNKLSGAALFPLNTPRTLYGRSLATRAHGSSCLYNNLHLLDINNPKDDLQAQYFGKTVRNAFSFRDDVSLSSPGVIFFVQFRPLTRRNILGILHTMFGHYRCKNTSKRIRTLKWLPNGRAKRISANFPIVKFALWMKIFCFIQLYSFCSFLRTDDFFIPTKLPCIAAKKCKQTGTRSLDPQKHTDARAQKGTTFARERK